MDVGEHTQRAVQDQHRKNWSTVPAEDRQRCIEALRAHVPPNIIALWTKQHRAGSIGEDDNWFHFQWGARARDVLRTALTDTRLPPAMQPNGEAAQNWDDFYLGALQELAEAGPQKVTP